MRFSAGLPPNLSLSDLELKITERESMYPDLTPGAAAGFVWAHSPPSVTDISIVYLHGFSATRKETWPLSDIIAHKLRANLFYPRLSSHGLTGKELAEANPEAWFIDVEEALEIGRLIGKKIVVIGMSTGATLAIRHACMGSPSDIAAWILLSPNLGLNNRLLHLLGSPFALPILRFIQGNLAGFKPFNPDHKKYWTCRYPLRALRHLIHVIKSVVRIKKYTVHEPVFIIYSPFDRVLDVRMIQRFYALLDTPVKQTLQINDCGNKENHVIAGAICSPETTRPIAEAIISFVHNHACEYRIPPR